jgi:O-acetyl-ADP-ribose deacetylase (regulator of RNase III)
MSRPPRVGRPACQIENGGGDVFEIEGADAIVNPWNRNYLPRLLLVPSGVSGALKRRTGPAPWKELRRRGLLDVGEAVVTDGGRMPGVSLIHVAGINALWRATDESVTRSAQTAVQAAWGLGCEHVVMPLIGAGTGGMHPARSRDLIHQALSPFESSTSPMLVTVVTYQKTL